MGNPVTHFEICGSDAEKTRKFYADLFGWNYEIHEEMNYAMVAAQDERGIGGGIMGSMEGVKPYVSFYVEVESLQDALDKAEKLGGKAIVPPTSIGESGSIAMFVDIDGNPIGLWSSATL